MRCSRAFVALVFAVLMTGAAGAQQAPVEIGEVPIVYVSSPADETIYQVIDAGESWQVEPVYYEADSNYRDLVYGPDQKLYACDPDQGSIIRFVPEPIGTDVACLQDYCEDQCDGDDVGEGFSACYTGCLTDCRTFGEDCDTSCSIGVSPTFELVYSGSKGYECGWFDASANLLVVNEDVEEDEGVWAFLGVAEDDNWVPSDPVPYPVDDAFPDTSSLSLTQLADADLLVLDSQQAGTVLRLEYDPQDGYEPSTGVSSVITDTLVAPIGLARLSFGDLFVTERGVIEQSSPLMSRWDYDPDADTWTANPGFDCEFIVEGDVHQPFWVEVAANNQLYVATSYLNPGSDDAWGILWRVDPADEGCDPEPLADFFFPDQAGVGEALVGVALSPTNTVLPLKYRVDEPGNGIFNFSDHVYEIEGIANPTSCEPTNTAYEAPPACLDRWLDYFGIGFDTEGYAYLGEEAFNMVYHVEEGQSCVPESDEFDIVISAFSDLDSLAVPKILVFRGFEVSDICAADPLQICPGPSCPTLEQLELTSFFPLTGFFPRDGRIASRASTFSHYVLATGQRLTGDDAGDFCGFRPPVKTALTGDDRMSTFREGRTVPLKFKVAEGEDGDCKKGPFIAPEGILLSIARVELDANGNPIFIDDEEVVCVGGGCAEVPYFDPPNNPKNGFHMNIRTDGFEPGIYQLNLLATGGEFGAAWTLIEIVE